MLLTHHHHDHVAELEAVLGAHPGTPVLIHPLERELVPGATGDDGARRRRSRPARWRSSRSTRPGHTAGMLSLLVDGTDVFTGDTLFKGSVGGVRAPGHTTYADLRTSIMDKLLALPPATRIHPATPTRRPSPTSSSTTGSCGSGGASTPRARSRARALGEPATLILLGDDYDGGHKAWVRWPDGADDIVPGSQVEQAGETAAWQGA